MAVSLRAQILGVRGTYVENREFGDDATELLVKGVLCELDLSHVESPDARDLELETVSPVPVCFAALTRR
jgi:hypothetical protein